MTPQAFSDAVREGGAVAVLSFVLAFLVIGAVREWWVPGPTARRERERADRLEERLERALTTTHSAVDLSESVVRSGKART